MQDAPLISLKVVDAFGDTVSFPRPPRRIVSLTPNQTELIFQLGAENKLKARSETSTTPERVRTYPVVRTQPALDTEYLQELQPDCILVTRELFEKADSMRLFFRQMGVPVLVQQFQDLEDFYRNTLQLGKLTKRREPSQLFVTAYRSLMDSLQARTEKKSLYSSIFILQFDPLTVIGGKHFVNDIAQVVTTRNVYAGRNVPYLVADRDSVMKKKPEFIFIPLSDDPNQLQELIALYPEFGVLPAVQQGRVFQIDMEKLMLPGPNTLYTVLELAQALHPEANPNELFGKIFMAQQEEQAPPQPNP